MWNWPEALLSLKEKQTPAVLVTVINTSGSTPREVGAKMIVLASGEFLGTIGGGNVEEIVKSDALIFLKDQLNKSRAYALGAKTHQCCGGVMEVFFECLNLGPRLYLFGAGHVSQAITQTMQGTPIQVQMIDEREEWAKLNSSGIHTDPINFAKTHEFSPDDYVAILTHSHDLDFELTKILLGKKLKYLGLIGSESKWHRFQKRLTESGFSLDDIKRVDCPMGIDIGGKAPQEVAISLSAKLLQIHYERI